MTMTLHFTLPITLISVYAPTADKTLEQKETFYEIAQKELMKAQNKGPTDLAGYVNARVQIHASPEETGIGAHTFDKEHITLDEQAFDTRQHREHFILHSTETNSILIDTFFEKRTANTFNLSGTNERATCSTMDKK